MISQVVILAAGESSRFFPFDQRHKCLSPLCGKPEIAHVLDSLKQAGITRVVIVQGIDRALEEALTPFIPPGLTVQYCVQTQALGMGDALLTAKDYLDEAFFVINPEQILFHKQAPLLLETFSQTKPVAMFLRAQTEDVTNFGILSLAGDTVLDVVEKPAKHEAPSNWRIVGTYLLTQKFIDILKSTNPEQYQFEKALAQACRQHLVLALATCEENPRLKYLWDLFSLKATLLTQLKSHISKQAFIAATALINGSVVIEDGAQIHDFAIIDGPAFIGKEVVIGRYCQVRSGSCIEDKAQIERYCDVRNSIIGSNTHIHSEFIGDSVIGSNCRIGAGFITANKRIDRQAIKITVKGLPVNSRMVGLGVFMGDSTNTGVRVTTMPGTVIGAHSTIGPCLTIKGVFPTYSKITSSNV